MKKPVRIVAVQVLLPVLAHLEVADAAPRHHLRLLLRHRPRGLEAAAGKQLEIRAVCLRALRAHVEDLALMLLLQ